MTCYVWKDGAVTIIEQRIHFEEAGPLEVMEYFLVDTSYLNPAQRYGKFIRNNDVSEGIEWKDIPIQNFPKEFKAHLLLLNIQ
jgi:hypothetical protein